MKPATKETSLRRELLSALMLTSGMVLLLAVVALVGYERLALRGMLAERFTLMTRVIADQCAAPLAFQNPRDAQEVLASLSTVRGVKVAGLYDSQNRLFATYPAGAPPSALPPEPGAAGPRYGEGRLAVVQPVLQAGDQLGMLYLQSDLNVINRRTRAFALIALAVMGAALLLAFFLSERLQARISRPVLALAETARGITQHGDYSTRAEKLTGGELGLLTDTFNRMLDEIQQREADLRQQQDRLRVALEAGALGAWDLDLATGSAWRSLRHDQIFGYETLLPQWTYEMFLEHVLPEDRERGDQRFRDALATCSTWTFECRIRRQDGEVRWIEALGSVNCDENRKPTRMFGVVRDVTERKQAEQELRRLKDELEERVEQRMTELTAANRELEAFGYTVSHDLRAPLRHIDGFIKMLENHASGSLDDKGRRYLQVIAQSAQRMGNLIDDMLTLSRVGRATIAETEVNLRRLVDEARQELAPALEGRRLEWQIGPLPIVRGDPNLLRVALVNVLSNAIKYTRPRNPARIEIGSEERSDEVICFVRDNGVGFNMEFVDKLFGVFQRLHRAQEFEGTGIGLASVRRIIQRHGGKTWAEGAVDHGATFYFSLPKRKRTEP